MLKTRTHAPCKKLLKAELTDGKTEAIAANPPTKLFFYSSVSSALSSFFRIHSPLWQK